MINQQLAENDSNNQLQNNQLLLKLSKINKLEIVYYRKLINYSNVT